MNNFLSQLPDDYREDILKAIDLLKQEGCSEIYIYGSLVKGNYQTNADIDFAVKGLTKGKYFEIGGKLMYLLKHEFDLIKLDDENSSLAQFIKQNEVMIRVA